jgi:glycosyltransferase involved in cell wall biosynthesis
MIRLLRHSGCEVIELHHPVWERFRDKSRGFGNWFDVFVLGLTIVVAYVSLVLRLLIRVRLADAVMIGYIGQLDMLLLGPLARLARKPVLFNPLVTLTDTVVEDRGLISRTSISARLIWLIDYLALRVASLVIVDTPENACYLERRFGIQQNRIAQIHVGADEDVFPGPQPELGANRNGGTVHVLFYGKMIPLHGIETILEALRLLDDERDITFEIVGGGQLENQVNQFLAVDSGSTIAYRPWVAYRRLPQRIALSDCVLGVFGASEKAARVVPNKVFQAMAMGAPIVTRDSPAIRRVLTDGESALLVPPEDPDALADAIRRLREPELRGRLGHNARRAFEVHGSDRALTRKLGDLLIQFVPENDNPYRPDRFRE